jgi:hypothetical protein
MRQFSALALSLAAFFLASTMTRADDDPLAKHRAFAGWRAGDGTIRDMRLTIVRKTVVKTAGGEESTVTTTQTRSMSGGRFRAIVERPESPSLAESGYDGITFWITSVNGYLARLSPLTLRAREELALEAIYDDAISNFPPAPTPAKAATEGDLVGVRVSPQTGLPVDLYMAADGAYRRAVLFPDARAPLVVEIEGYIDVLPGKKIIGKYRIGSAEYEVTKVEANLGLARADLSPPAPYSIWSFGNDTVPIHVNVSDGGSRQVIVTASLDGHVGRFLLDSGASTILLSNSFVATDLEKVGTSAFSGINGRRESADLVRIKELTVGSSTLRNVVVQKSTSTSIGGGVDGLLGYDFLAGAIVEVDLRAQTLKIRDPSTYQPTPGEHAAAFPVDGLSRRPVTPVQIGEGAKATAILDTGNSYGVLLSDALRASGKVISLGGRSQYFSGADGTGNYALDCARLSRMYVGPYPYENASVCFGSPQAFGSNGGLIGFDFLRHFNWTFDYPHGRFILTPNGVN